MNEEGDPGDEARQELQFVAARVAHHYGESKGLTVSRKFVKILGELAVGYADELQKDMERFARHARRTTVQVDDVLLCARRNEDLEQTLSEYATRQLNWSGQGGSKKKRGSDKKDNSGAASADKKRGLGRKHQEDDGDGHDYAEACERLDNDDE